LDGKDVLHATARSEVSGWGIGVNIPYALMTEQLRKSMLIWGAAAVLAIAIALAFGVLFARQITRSLSIATSAADAFGRDEAFTITDSRLKEVDTFLATLKDAQRARAILTEELKQNRNSLQSALQVLRESDRKKDEFLAILAHELRNPLAPIGHAVTLLSLPSTPESQRA